MNRRNWVMFIWLNLLYAISYWPQCLIIISIDLKENVLSFFFLKYVDII